MSNLNHLSEKLEKKYQKRDNKKRKKMKVSGRRIFGLKELLVKKGKTD